MRQAVLGLVIVVLVVCGGWLVVTGLQPRPVASLPVPAQTYHVPDAPLRPAPAPADGVEVQHADTGTTPCAWDTPTCATPVAHMRLEDTAAMSVFIADLGIYAEIRAESDFVPTKYDGFATLSIPTNPHRASWFSGGAPLAGGTEGTTLLASHVAYDNVLGAFSALYAIAPGTEIVTKDAAGAIQRWKATAVTVLDHQQFPDEYFLPHGPRRLVLATCGGRANEQGYYEQNIFIEAVPI